ncbi:hypothetical protein ACJ7V3_12715 [Halomonas elongata]|uniref:hypothetical protein n=1 Tax=Halomonas elongata TaxID=2746 RepID=UPI0038D3B369
MHVTCPAIQFGEFSLPIPNLMADYSAPVPELNDRVSLLAQPASLTWRWNKQGGRI